MITTMLQWGNLKINAINLLKGPSDFYIFFYDPVYFNKEITMVKSEFVSLI